MVHAQVQLIAKQPPSGAPHAKPRRVQHKMLLFVLGMTPLLTISSAVSTPAGVPPLGLVVVPWVMVVVGGLSKKSSWDIRLPRGLVALLSLWAIAALLSLIIRPDGYILVAGRLLFIALIVMAYASLRGNQEIAFFRRIYLGAMVVHSLLTLVHAYGLVSLPFADQIRGRKVFAWLPNRTLGIKMSYGEYGILLSLAFALLFARLFSVSAPVRHRWLQWLVFGFLLIGLLIAQSRNVFVGFGAMLAAIVMLGNVYGTLSRRGRAFSVVLALAALGVLWFAGAKASVALLYAVNEETVASRVNQLPAALQMIREHPIMGSGYGAFNDVYRERRITLTGQTIRYEVGLHNAFLNEFVSVGLFFGSVYVLIFLWVSRTLLRCARDRRLPRDFRAFAVCLLAGFAYALLALNLFPGFYVEVLAIMIALAARLHQIRRQIVFRLKYRGHTEFR